MLFNSIDYLVFLPLSFIVYWLLSKKGVQAQNTFLLIASYIFYGWWDYRFLSLIAFSTLVDYVVGLNIHRHIVSNKRLLFLLISIFVNLGMLFYFKYYNFFIDSFARAFGLSTLNNHTLQIILPVGISFYTFQTMSYSIDIYRKKITPTKNFISFATFVSFFPQLVAGPIERASNLLPQILEKRTFVKKNFINGLYLILWGLFKKVAVADSLAPVVENLFANYQTLNGGELWIGAIYFAIQIYCDFSGYSDIAIGTAELFGFELKSNFKRPFFSRDFREFWNRWHISLNTWFSDYLFKPIGGAKKGKFNTFLNTLIVFMVSGLWHGANWTFIIWGFISWILYVPALNRLYSKTNTPRKKHGINLNEIHKMLLTFISFAWSLTFFRAPSFTDAMNYNIKLFSSIPDLDMLRPREYIYILVLIVIEWVGRDNEKQPLYFKNRYFSFWIILIILILTFINFGESPQEFIYFNF